MAEPNDPTAALAGFADPVQVHQALMQLNVAQFPPQAMMLVPKDKKITRRKFTPEEDEILRNLVAQYGKSDWCTIAGHFQNRSARQCRDRWKHYISPEVVTGNWTEEEEQLLLNQVQEIGQRWSTIAQLFPGRTDIGVKNHYISITSRKNKDGRDRTHQRAILLPLGNGLKLDDGVPMTDAVGTVQIPLELPPADDQTGHLLPVGMTTGDSDPTAPSQ